jgi:hypothetical protein
MIVQFVALAERILVDPDTGQASLIGLIEDIGFERPESPPPPGKSVMAPFWATLYVVFLAEEGEEGSKVPFKTYLHTPATVHGPVDETVEFGDRPVASVPIKSKNIALTEEGIYWFRIVCSSGGKDVESFYRFRVNPVWNVPVEAGIIGQAQDAVSATGL